MKKSIIILTVIIVLGILYSIFLHKQSEYVAGETRHYTAYEKFKAKEKSVSFSPNAYEQDKYNLERLKNKVKKEIANLEKYRIELISTYNLIYNPNNSVSDYEKHIKTLEKVEKEIENNRNRYDWQKRDLSDLNEFINEIEQDLYSIKLYKSDIAYVSSVLNSIDSTASKYLNSVKILEYASASRGMELVKLIEEKKERKRQELITEIKLERELEKLKKEREYYNSFSSYPSNSHLNSATWNNSYSRHSNISQPTLPSYSTNTNLNHVQVNGYYKKDGTYVESYIRTAPNNTIIDNFSTSPNLNPYTGKIGTIKFNQ